MSGRRCRDGGRGGRKGILSIHAGLGEAEHDIAGLAALFTDGSARDFALGVTKARMSFSEALVLSGISGRWSTRRSSSLRRSGRFNRRSIARRFGVQLRKF